MKIVEENNETFIFPFADNAIEQENEDYCIRIKKGKFTLVDERRMTVSGLKSLAKALNEAALRVQSLN